MQHSLGSSTEQHPKQRPMNVGDQEVALLSLNLTHPPDNNYWMSSSPFVCRYCNKRFPSSQSLGGHQNAHRAERNEEKRLFIKNPTAYRRRAFLLRSLKPPEVLAESGGGGGAARHNNNNNNNNNNIARYQPYNIEPTNWKPKRGLDYQNLQPPPVMRELRANNVGEEEGGEEEGGENSQSLDLTLKL